MTILRLKNVLLEKREYRNLRKTKTKNTSVYFVNIKKEVIPTMLSLTDKEIWSKLEDPYGYADYMPQMIEELYTKPEKELIDDICWECIYHQGTLYSVTFAVIPYLLDFCMKQDNKALVWNTIVNLGVILIDVDDRKLDQIYKNADLESHLKEEIILEYKKAMQTYSKLVESLKDYASSQEEIEKRYFLVALALAEDVYQIGDIFQTFSGNDEYICECPKCQAECYLENENDDGDLTLYDKDPILDDDAKTYPIEPRQSTSNPQFPLANDELFEYKWLCYYVKLLDIKSLKNISHYLFGTAVCPHCNEQISMFDYS